MLLGEDGIISASGKFLPELAVKVFQEYLQKDYEKVIESNQKLIEVPSVFKLDSPFINIIKTATRMRGIGIGEYVLPPLTDLNKDKERKLREMLIPFLEADELPGKGE